MIDAHVNIDKGEISLNRVLVRLLRKLCKWILQAFIYYNIQITLVG